ncbi:hypothetical protein BH23CHL8_BH23CHL8_10370 [soil metagenome]
MTARQELRVGSAAAQRDSWSIETQRAPLVGEILQTARERKGVDLIRAERETKIRARHLMALESGDLDDMPAPVYAKGFLRNYSRYLELDPDEMLSRWRREVDQPRSAEAVKMAPPPQPITAPRHGLKLTSGLLVALALAVVVTGFLGYVGLQLVRFSQNPEVALRGPTVRWLAPGDTRIVLTGTGSARSRITASGSDDLVRTTTADSAGAWAVELPVSKGRNDFNIVSTDPETGRDSDPLQVIATVPVAAEASPDARPTPALPEGAVAAGGTPSAAVVLISPAEGARVRRGKVKVEGTSDAESVLVSFQWLGKNGQAPGAPAPLELAVQEGVFRGSFTLPRGRWQVAVAGQIGGGAPAVITRAIRSMPDQVEVTVEAVDGFTRINVEVDGETVTAGRRLGPGEWETFRAKEEIVLRAGNGRAAHVTVDGVQYGAMGKQPEVRTWVIAKGKKPQVQP